MSDRHGITVNGKDAAYCALVADRKRCRQCAAHLRNASDIDGGVLDSNHIGPYTQWQGNLDSSLLIVAQDFSNIDGFKDCRGWPSRDDCGTNENIVVLVREAGVEISPPQLGKPDDVLFFTNAVLCMKTGGRQQKVANQCFDNCSGFLRRTIDVVSPRIVATLGIEALDAVRHAFDLPDAAHLREVVGKHLRLTAASYLVPLYHPSPTVVNTHRSLDTMRADWRGMRPLLE